jgi:hypothetical protein
MNALFLSLAPGFSQVIARGKNISAVSTAFPSFSKLLKQLVPCLCFVTGLKPGANESRSHAVGLRFIRRWSLLTSAATILK